MAWPLFRVEFKYESDPDKKYQDVVREMDALKNELPQDIFDIKINKFNPTDVSIVQIGLLSETAPYKDLEEWSKKVEGAPGKGKNIKERRQLGVSATTGTDIAAA